MKISVIIPTYKPNKYLYECLCSIKNQTLCKEEFEVIIVLNGVEKPYYNDIDAHIIENNLNNVKLYYLKKTGVSNARNYGLKVALGHYIVFVDDDDLISKNYLKSLITLASEDTIVVSNFKTFRSNLKNYGGDYISKSFSNLIFKNKSSLFINRHFFSSVCGKIIPKKVINNRLFDVNFSNSEDSLFMFAISDKIRRVELSGENVNYYRRLRGQSASRKRFSPLMQFRNYFKLERKYFKIYFNNFPRYDFIFFLSRIFATTKYLAKCIKRKN